MKIKNLTPEVQKVVVKELTGDKKLYDIFIVPHGTTDVDRMTIVEPKEISGILEVEGTQVICNCAHVVEEVEESTRIIIDDHSDDKDESSEPEAPLAGETFICDICGAEFGSARGLASHKNRSHADN